MKKSRYLAIALASAFVLIFTGCGSTPKEESSTSEEQAVVENNGQGSNVGDVSADTVEALMAALEESRQKAIDAGAEGTNPLAFQAAEKEYAAALAAGNAEGADVKSILKDLNSRYLAMEAYSKALQKKNKIEENDLASYNQKAFDEGNAILATLKDEAVAVLPGAQFYAQAKACESKYDEVLYSAYKVLAKEERVNAFEAKKLADSVKSAVAKKAEYDKGVAAFKAGDVEFVTGNPEVAYNNYVESKNVFITLYETIYSARQLVQAKIDEAKLRVAESEEMAEQADVEAPLADDAEGIEEEDAKLLEDDDFTEAQNAAVEIEETLKVGE